MWTALKRTCCGSYSVCCGGRCGSVLLLEYFLWTLYQCFSLYTCAFVFRNAWFSQVMWYFTVVYNYLNTSFLQIVPEFLKLSVMLYWISLVIRWLYKVYQMSHLTCKLLTPRIDHRFCAFIYTLSHWLVIIVNILILLLTEGTSTSVCRTWQLLDLHHYYYHHHNLKCKIPMLQSPT